MPTKKKPDLRLLLYFQATAEAGNITRAARQLNVAQPTLSKAIRVLEAQLGAPLLRRGAQGVVPTEIGERLLRHVRLVTAQVSDALSEVESLATGAAGRIRVGAGPSWVRRLLPDAVAALLAEAPDIEVRVTTGFDERLLEGLLDGGLDLVVAERPLSGGEPGFSYTALTRDSLVVCARAGHPLAGAGRVALADAIRATWALPSGSTLARRKLAGRMALMGLAEPRRVLTSNSITFLLTFALKTDSLVYTTRSMLRTPEAAGLVEVEVPELVAEREAGIITRAGAALSPAAQALVARLVAACREDPAN